MKYAVMKLTTRIYLGYLTVLVLFTIVTVVNIDLSKKINRDIQWISHAEDIMKNSALLQKAMVDMETGLRGFMLSEREEFLEPYYDASVDYRNIFSDQQKMLQDQPERVEDVKRIIKDMNQWIDYFALPLINAKKQAIADPEKTQSYDVLFNSTARKGIGKRITDSIRDRFDSFDHKIEARKVEKTIELIKASRKADNISLALNLFAFIFAFGTALFITKMIGKRIDRMVKLAERISYGDFNMEFTDRREDELSTLSSSLVVMAATLRDNFEKLEKINRELEESKKEIERTANIKEQFLTNMSHEIRTPLNAIIGFSGLLWDSELNEDQRQQLSIIKSSGKNLITIINDVLDFSRLNADKVRIEKRSFRLPRLINEVIELFSLMAKEKRIELTSFVDKGIPEYVSGDIVRLRQVLVNLVGNAVKFTNKGKVILDTRLNSVTSSYYDISFSITDTGIGIHKEDLPHIFDSFVQGSRDVTGRYGGSGLGLAIVKRLGDLMGGTIDVKSELHRGSTFTLAIPLEKPYEEGTGFETHTIKDSGFPVIEKIRVLLVEDNLFNQQLVAAILKSWNWNLTTAGNGRSAIKCLEDQEFDVVLMDVRLPDMDGYEIVRYIRKELPPDKSGVPVIAITAHSFASEEEKCRAAGMNDFLSKPFEKEKLYSKVVCLTGRTGSQEGHAVCPESPEGDLKYEKVVDLDYLKRIMNNDPDYIKVIIRDFISQAADSLADLKLMYRNFEWGLIKALAHKLKTSYMIMGIKQARDILCKIEEYHFHGLNDPVADEMIRQFVEISEKALEELKNEPEILTLNSTNNEDK